MTMATKPRPAARAESTATPGPADDLRSLLGKAAGDPEQRWVLLGALVCLGILGLTFQVNLRHFLHAWSTDENYSHGFLVPFISLYFANEAAKRGPVALRGGTFAGILLLVVSLLGRLAMVLVPIPFLGDLAFLVGLAGICSLIAGTAALRRYWFAIVFLVFMVPLPIALYTRIASPLQLMASQFATAFLNATGVPVLCEGNMMTLPGDVQMFVAEACSGMRQLTGFLALTAAVAYLARRPWWYRVGVIASAVPIALTANIARVILTGYIMYFFDSQYASGTYHTIEGLLMMTFGLSLLRGGCWMLDQLSSLLSPPVPPDGGTDVTLNRPLQMPT